MRGRAKGRDVVERLGNPLDFFSLVLLKTASGLSKARFPKAQACHQVRYTDTIF